MEFDAIDVDIDIDIDIDIESSHISPSTLSYSRHSLRIANVGSLMICHVP
jgi:hypothetical protein